LEIIGQPLFESASAASSIEVAGHDLRAKSGVFDYVIIRAVPAEVFAE